MSEIIGLREKWDKRFIKLAEFISTWSKDKTKVGAVIVVEKDGAIALGFNGFPTGIKDDRRLKDKEEKNKIIIHAEENALRIAGNRANEATLYVFGKPVCSDCAKGIVQFGISRIVCMNPEDEHSKKWQESGRDAIEMFKEAGIKVKYYKVRSS
jgi:dCMP deaminase